MNTQTQISQLTLQGVKDGKEVHEWQVHRPPGEKSKAPSEAQEYCYPHNASHILQRGAVLQILRVLSLYPTQLDQHHDEHDKVKQKNDAEIDHHCHIESNVIFQPAAVVEDMGWEKIKGLVSCFCAGFIFMCLRICGICFSLCLIMCMLL